MKYSLNSGAKISKEAVAFAVAASVVCSAVAGGLGSKIDDFGDAKKNSFGVERQYIDDSAMGGKTKAVFLGVAKIINL